MEIVNEDNQCSEQVITIPSLFGSNVLGNNFHQVVGNHIHQYGVRPNITFSENFRVRSTPSVFDINEILLQNSEEQQSNSGIKKREGLVLAKRGFLDNDFLSVTSNYEIHYNLLNTESGVSFVKSYKSHTDRVNDFVLLGNYSAFASGGKDNKVKIWDLKGGNKVVKEFGLTAEVTCLSVYDEFLCVGSGKGVVIWSTKTMKPFAKINFLHSDTILSLQIKEVAGVKYMITSAEDSLINILNLSDPNITQDSVINTINTNQAATYANLLGDVTHYLYAINSNETLSLYNLEKNTEVMNFDAKDESLGINYIVDAKEDSNGNLIKLRLGNFEGSIIEAVNTSGSDAVQLLTVAQTGKDQRFYSILDFDGASLAVSDEGLYYVLK